MKWWLNRGYLCNAFRDICIFFLNMGDLTYDDEYDDRNVPRMAFPSFTRKGGLNNIILYVPEVLFIFTQ